MSQETWQNGVNFFYTLSDEKGKAAFTLAEKLITLVIIGVAAALTVPSLMNKTFFAFFFTKKSKMIIRNKKHLANNEMLKKFSSGD